MRSLEELIRERTGAAAEAEDLDLVDRLLVASPAGRALVAEALAARAAGEARLRAQLLERLRQARAARAARLAPLAEDEAAARARLEEHDSARREIVRRYTQAQSAFASAAAAADADVALVEREVRELGVPRALREVREARDVAEDAVRADSVHRTQLPAAPGGAAARAALEELRAVRRDVEDLEVDVEASGERLLAACADLRERIRAALVASGAPTPATEASAA